MVRQIAALFGVAALALAGFSPSPARADDAQTPSYASHEDTIHGRISEFDGQYNLKVRDDKGYVDSVHMHDGTIINPTGLRLATGLSVQILGHGNGNVFEANEIDTPYTEDPGPAPDYVAPAYDYGPAYSYYGDGCCYGYGYGYGFPFSFGLAFGYGGYYGGYGRGYGYGYGYGHGGYGYGHGGYGRGGYYGYGRGYNTGRGYNSSSAAGRRYTTGGARSYGGGARSYAGGAGARSSGGGGSRGGFSGGRSSGGGGHR